MTTISTLDGSVIAGVVLALLLAYGWYQLLHKRQFRNLASAFVGEIVAILRTIEMRGTLANLEEALATPEFSAPISNLTLPRFVIYEAEADKLENMAAPLPRKITYFYTRLNALQIDMNAFDSKSAQKALDKNRTARMQSMLGELKETLNLGDDILHDLRPFISVEKRPAPLNW